MVNRDEMNHLEDEEWDRNRAKRERLEECSNDVHCGVHTSMAQCRLQKARMEKKQCGSNENNPKSGTDQST